MHAQHVKPTGAQRFRDRVRVAADEPQITDRAFAHFFPVGADSQDFTTLARDETGRLEKPMLFPFENEVDPRAPSLGSAHHIEKCIKNIADGNHADQTSLADHRKSANLMPQHDLCGLFHGHRGSRGNRVFGHHAVDLGVLEMSTMLAQIPVGYDADDLAIAHDWQAAKAAGFHLVRGSAQQVLRFDRFRLTSHAVANEHNYSLPLPDLRKAFYSGGAGAVPAERLKNSEIP